MAQASTETSLLQPIAVADNVQREDSQLIPYSLYAQEIEKYRAEKENLVQVILKINQILSLSVETLADKEFRSQELQKFRINRVTYSTHSLSSLL